MDAPSLLTTRQRSDSSLVIVDGETEIAAVFGSPRVRERRAAELIAHANTFRELRAVRASIKIPKKKNQPMNTPVFTILKRRDGSNFRYSLSYLDSANIAILETDNGDPNNPHAKREPTRRLCVANISHIDELQDRCDEWNATNQQRQSEWSPYIDVPNN